MTDAKLMNLFWSSAGVYPMEAEIGTFDFERRARSAAKAGFAGMSFWHTDLDRILETRSLGEVKRILDDNGLSTFEVEFVEDWFVDGAGKAASDRRKWRLLEASQALGAHHVKVGDFHNMPVKMAALIDAFGVLCADAAGYGATIGFEFMASAMISRLEDCLTMVQGADAANGGLIFDIAHTNALGISNEDVASIPGRFVISAELGDNLRASNAGIRMRASGATLRRRRARYCGLRRGGAGDGISGAVGGGSVQPRAGRLAGRGARPAGVRDDAAVRPLISGELAAARFGATTGWQAAAT